MNGQANAPLSVIIRDANQNHHDAPLSTKNAENNQDEEDTEKTQATVCCF
jgi:hypothetical protein